MNKLSYICLYTYNIWTDQNEYYILKLFQCHVVQYLDLKTLDSRDTVHSTQN